MEVSTLQQLNLDKSNWALVKFGEVVAERRESIKDPHAAGIEYVVGLEHIDSENIHLKRSATLEDSTTFTKKFEVGDVLFGRRRAYLKKAVQASFSGICSGDITVMRAKENLLPELLPFIVNNEKFFDYAVKHSAGGLSPRVKFKDLANYEFLLPPKEEQARLAELLWAMDEVVEKEREVLERLEVGFQSNRKGFVEQGLSQKGIAKKMRFGNFFSEWETDKLSTFCELIGGNAFKSISFREKGDFQVLRIGNLTKNGFDLTKKPVFVNDISEKERKYSIPKGAIVMSLTGTNGKRDYGFPSLMEENNKFFLNQRLVMLIPDSQKMIPEFLFLLSKMELFQGPFFLNATGTANQANVSIADISNIKLPIPSIREQKGIITRINQFIAAHLNLKSKITSSQSLQKSLINQIF